MVGLARELHESRPRGLGGVVRAANWSTSCCALARRTSRRRWISPRQSPSPKPRARSAASSSNSHIDLVHSFSATARWRSIWRCACASPTASIGVRLVSSPMGLQNSPRELPVTTWLRNWFLALGAEQILVISPEIRRHLKRRRRARTGTGRLQLRWTGHRSVPAFGPTTIASVRREFGFAARRADRLDDRRAPPAQEPRAVHRGGSRSSAPPSRARVS